MKLAATIKGEGKVRVGKIAHPVSYEIEVFDDGRTKAAQGKLDGKFADLLDLMDEDQSTLELSTGQAITIIVDRVVVTTAYFAVVGPVPGV